MIKNIIKKGSIINTETGTTEILFRNEGGLFRVIEREYDLDGNIEEEESWKTKHELELDMRSYDSRNHLIIWQEDWEEEDE